MRTSIIALVLVAAVPAVGRTQSPSWQTDYSAAQRQAMDQQKPLAVLFGQGATGWQQLGGGSLTSETNRLLADKYICCYVDTATPVGQALALKFELNKAVGMVLSDHTGNLQAFWHEGSLSADALAGYLTKYGDPQRTVNTTDTNLPTPRTSYYPPGAYPGTLYAPMAEPFCRT